MCGRYCSTVPRCCYLGTVYLPRHGEWRRLTEPATAADRRLARQLWDDVRAAKEALSRVGCTLIHLPLLEEDAPVGREQLEQIARPLVERTVAATRTAIREAGLDPSGLAGVLLVGGASRLPLAATMLHRALGLAAFVSEQPELVVAEGSLTAPASPAIQPAPEPAIQPGLKTATKPVPEPAREPGPEPGPEPAPVLRPDQDRDPPSPKPPHGSTRRRQVVAAGLAVLVAFAVVVFATATRRDADRPSGAPQPTPTSASSAATPPFVDVLPAGPLDGSAGGATAVEFGPDGTALMVVGADRVVRVWNIQSRRPLRGPLNSPEQPVDHPRM